VRTQSDLAVLDLVPYRTVPDVLDAVESGEIDRGFVPIENSIEGTVNLTQDALVFDHDLYIQREVVLDIKHFLLALPGTKIADVAEVHSMPVATAQCHAFLRKELPKAEIRAVTSTAEAARRIAEDKLTGVAAIAPESAAQMYGLDIIARDIADHDNNQTRFILVGKDSIPAPTGHDRTAIVVFQRADEPGSLISILQEFAARRINIGNLQSRPTKNSGLGDYCFIIYADGHVADELMADALRELHAKQGGVKFFGSFPAAGQAAHNAREHADVRWRDADDWVSHLRARITG
jgi:prephenate dehydratase